MNDIELSCLKKLFLNSSKELFDAIDDVSSNKYIKYTKNILKFLCSFDKNISDIKDFYDENNYKKLFRKGYSDHIIYDFLLLFMKDSLRSFSKESFFIKYKFSINNINYLARIRNKEATLYVASSVDENKAESNFLEYFYKQGYNLFIGDEITGKFELFKIETENNLYKTNDYNKIYNYCKSFIDKNKNRSILLYGNPGSGKSTIAKMIINNFNFNYIKFCKCKNLFLAADACEAFKPDAIIFDDFDKLNLDSASTLEALELLKKQVKLILFTANDIDLLNKNKAIVRPGRIDEFFEINKLNDKVILDILGEGNEDLFDKMKDFPIAFMNECKNIIEVFGKQYLIDNFDKMVKRVKNNEIICEQ